MAHEDSAELGEALMNSNAELHISSDIPNLPDSMNKRLEADKLAGLPEGIDSHASRHQLANHGKTRPTTLNCILACINQGIKQGC